MLRITLKAIRGHIFRFLLTTLAVILGVSFVVASFVLRDGLKNTFNELIEQINADVDVEVRGFTEFSESDFQDDPLIDDSLLDAVRSVEGVDEAIGGVGFAGIVPVDGEGDALQAAGPPLLGFTWADSSLTPLQLIEGTGPGRGEFVMDVDTASDNGFRIGETYEVIFPNGAATFTLTGLVSFGENNDLPASITAYESDEFRELTDTVGKLQTISIRAAAGVTASELAARIQTILPADAEAVTSDTVVEEAQADLGQIIDVIGGALTGFGLVSLLVAAFLIANIFNITVGQRLRELALLRAVGATTSQVRASVVFEALIIGLLASILGIAAGAGLALTIRALMDAVGFSLPSFAVTISGWTIFSAFAIGIVVTVLASLMPAFQAGRVPPVAAMREGYQIPGRPKVRLALASIITLVGALMMFNGLFGNASGIGLVIALGAGSVLVFVGVTTFSPLFAAPVVTTLGAPLRRLPWLGVAGRLAQQNSARSARNTAAAAGALMIGLALVAGAGVFGESLKKTISNTLTQSVDADFIAQTDGFSDGFGQDLAAEMRALPELDRVAAFRFGNIRVAGEEKDVWATNFDQLVGLVDPDVVAGSMEDATSDSVMLHEDPAGDLGVSPGDTISVDFAGGTSAQLTVAAVYSDPLVLGNWTIDIATWDEHFSLNKDLFVMARIADGTDPAVARAAVDTIADRFPQVDLQDQSEFLDSQEAQVDGFLLIINVLLALALFIAILGITITMTLAVFERTREIGLLRAVGMTTTQARSMIRWEAALIAMFGALLGTALGVVFGWAAVTAIPDSIVNTFAVPWISLVIFIVISAIAGLVAGLYPAIRAGRMNVLEAISHL